MSGFALRTFLIRMESRPSRWAEDRLGAVQDTDNPVPGSRLAVLRIPVHFAPESLMHPINSFRRSMHRSN